MPEHKPLVAITTGEPAGIGPDICLSLAASIQNPEQLKRLVFLGDETLLAQRAKAIGLDPLVHAQMQIQHVALQAPCKAGQLDSQNSAYVLELLDTAIAGCMSGAFSAMVTAPLQKSVIAQTGLSFSGHTEYLAEKTATPHVVMMLVCPSMKVALATTHLPLAAVPSAITKASLTETLNVLLHDLTHHFHLPNPRVLVTGLNPHAGEGGHLGREEIDVIEPVIKQFVQAGHDVRGPFPADTLFQTKYLEHADAVLAMYHDQGLPVLKYAGFGESVNITLGLPFVRTSVDHGTALDLAGTGKASHTSLLAAVEMALTLTETES